VRSVARFLLALCLLAVAALAGCDSGGGSEPEPQPRPAPAITSKELTGHLAALQRIADANGGNRSAGTHGYDASADYVAARLSDAGWKVTRQPVPYGYFRLDDASLTVGGRRLERAKQFQVLSYSGSGRAVGRLRAAGTGCSEDDYAGLGPSDIPLVDRGICFFRDKARNAERAGSRALVVSEVVRTRTRSRRRRAARRCTRFTPKKLRAVSTGAMPGCHRPLTMKPSTTSAK